MATSDASIDTSGDIDLTRMSQNMLKFLNAYDNIFQMGKENRPIIKTSPTYLHELHVKISRHDNIDEIGSENDNIDDGDSEDGNTGTVSLHEVMLRNQHRGGAPRSPIPGRDAMNNITTPAVVSPNIATTVSMMNTVNPVTVAMDPSNVLSEHVMRIMNDDSSSLSFKVDVHVILAPGDNGIGIADKVGYACESSKQDMSRSWSEITGKPYYPTARKE